MQRIYRVAFRLARQAQRFRIALLVVGAVSFLIITADYARLIELPKLAKLPLWVGVMANIVRWAVWEGVLKPQVQASALRPDRIETTAPDVTRGK